MTLSQNLDMYQQTTSTSIYADPISKKQIPLETGDLSSSLAPEKHFPILKTNSKNFLFFFSSDTEIEEDEEDNDSELYCTDSDLLDSDSELFSVHDDDLSDCSDGDFACLFEDTEPQPCELPFWYENEDEEHICCIFEAYSNALIQPHELQNRSSQPFIGRIERFIARCDSESFQTFDCVTICNCQRMPMHNLTLPVMRTDYCVTTYNSDGIPCCINKLTKQQEGYWRSRVMGCPSSYLYCEPDWHNQGTVQETEFYYSSSPNENDVTYHGLPPMGNFAPFVSVEVPSKLRVPVKEGLASEF